MWFSAVRYIVTLILSLLAVPLTSQAQRPPTIPRIGFIHPISAAAGGYIQLDAFRQGLHDLGYVEGETITLEVR
jgi:putative ABC transport system substrate-binding protein